MREALQMRRREHRYGACIGDRTVREVVAAADRLRAGDLDERHRPGFPRLEAHRGTGRDVEALAVSELSVELQRGVGLNEVVVAAYLHGAVAEVGHGDLRGRASCVE